MIRLSLLAFVWLVAAALASPSSAKVDASADFRQMRMGEALQLRADRAYILLRIDTSLAHFAADFLRVPDRTELDAYDAAKRVAYEKSRKKAPIEAFAFEYEGRPNVYELSSNKPLAQDGKVVTALAEVTPGDYVFYGVGFRNLMTQSMCLGTVGFAAPAGQVTDLGTMLTAMAAKPSTISELAGEVDLGPSARIAFAMFAVALRPRRADDAMPTGLRPEQVVPARLHAVGPFVEAGNWTINRLAAIPGVLAYDNGRVIDVASGREAPAN